MRIARWPLLLLLVVLCLAATAGGAISRDRDRDGLPDRWEKQHGLSTRTANGGRDTDHDGLTNRREWRLKTNPRRKDTDRDHLRDGAEVRRYHTNPRKKDTDGDGYPDGVEVRSHTNPRKRSSHPSGVAIPAPGAVAPLQSEQQAEPAPGGFPNAASTGVPDGWQPAQTRSSDLTVTTPGTVIEDVRLTDGADINVKAADVTIRRVDMQGGSITNQFGNGCGTNLLVEDTTFEQVPGHYEASDSPVIGEGGYTARRIKVDGRGEGPRLSNCGPVTLEDSYISIRGADPGTPECSQVHSDGVQAYGGVGATARNNTIIFQTPCGTSPWFVTHPESNSGSYTVDRLLVGGGGYVFRQSMPGTVTGLRVIDRSWIYGPLGDMDCSKLSQFEAKVVTVDASLQVTRTVRTLRCS